MGLGRRWNMMARGWLSFILGSIQQARPGEGFNRPSKTPQGSLIDPTNLKSDDACVIVIAYEKQVYCVQLSYSRPGWK